MYDVKRSARGATRNNLIFNDVSIFRVGDSATLKMLNSFIVSLLRGAPYYLLFNIGNLFSGLDILLIVQSVTFFRTRHNANSHSVVQVEYLGEIKRNPKICVNL